MRAVLQRVSRASVTVEDKVVGEIAYGLVVLLGVMKEDTQAEALWLARKTAELRVFEDADGKMNLSLLDRAALGEGAEVLVISQFTLAADGKKGRRPSFERAARPEVAEPIYEFFCGALQDMGLRVQKGKFRATMHVALVNEGPATFVLERAPAPDGSVD